MQPLLRTLHDHDLGHLRIVAELWGLEAPGGSPVDAARALASAMLQPEALRDMVDGLPPEAARVLHVLIAAGGRMPLADLTRRFGPLREIGAGRRDREKVWRQPASPLEGLWYRGLLARAFADSPTGPVEMGFIPSDLLALLPPEPTAQPPLGQPAREPAVVLPAKDSSPEDAVALLAALRRRPSRELEPSAAWLAPLAVHLINPDAARLLLTLLRDLGLAQGPPLRLQAREVPAFLSLSRADVARRLLRAWADSTTWNDLAHGSGLDPAGKPWPNDPHAARQIVLSWLADLPRGAWWDLDGFVTQVREQSPGFQRPGGDFDSWYLRDPTTGQFRRGFEAWDDIEGRLLRFIITGPLHWLGAIDLGRDLESRPPHAFRIHPILHPVSADADMPAQPDRRVPCQLLPNGQVLAPLDANPEHRYQVARWAAWEPRQAEAYVYRITPRAVEIAGRQGLRPGQLMAILKAACGDPVPEALARAIQRAASRGTEARLQSVVVLRLSSPRLLEELRRHRSTARYLGEVLGRDAVALRSSDWHGLCVAAAQLGLLIEPP